MLVHQTDSMRLTDLTPPAYDVFLRLLAIENSKEDDRCARWL